MNTLYFERIDNDLIFELESGIDIASGIDDFLDGEFSTIELALLGYFTAKEMNPRKAIEEVKESIKRQMESGARAFTVFYENEK